MELTLEKGVTLQVQTRAELEHALADLGSEGNEFAILAKEGEVYLQADSRAMEFLLEYRDGSEDAHFESRRRNFSHAEVVRLFTSYLEGTSAWRESVEWSPSPIFSGKTPGAGVPRGRVPLLAVIFAAIGLGMTVWGIRLATGTRAFIERSATAPGTVVELVRGRGRSGSYFPVVRFETRGGRTVTFRNRTGGSPPSHRVGETVPVRYDPAQPAHAIIDDALSLWLGPILVGGMGLLLCTISLGVVLLRMRGAERAGVQRLPGSPAPRSDRGIPRR